MIRGRGKPSSCSFIASFGSWARSPPRSAGSTRSSSPAASASTRPKSERGYVGRPGGSGSQSTPMPTPPAVPASAGATVGSRSGHFRPTRSSWSRGTPARCYDDVTTKVSMMGFYQNQILPRLIHSAMRREDLKAYRQRVVSAAAGRVLEIGIGSGLNMPFYGAVVTEVIGLDPSAQLLAMAQRVVRPGIPIDFIEGSAESIPLENASVDTVLTTWTL